MSNDYKACPFLCEMRDLEIGMESQVIGYLCKAQCKDCPAHNNTVKALQAENEKLKSDLDGQKLVSKIAYADIRKLCDENDLLEKEIARIKMLIAYRRDVLLEMIRNHHEASLINEYNTMNILIEAINNPTKESEGEDE
jgi:hypothetical protein